MANNSSFLREGSLSNRDEQNMISVLLIHFTSARYSLMSQSNVSIIYRPMHSRRKLSQGAIAQARG